MEIWKDIKDYEGLYQVNNFGIVKSLPRTVINKRGNTQTYPGKTLKPDICQMANTSYSRVTLSKEHDTQRYLVHRLVAEAFIPNVSGKPFVNHLDNNAQHNFVDNLEWCTHTENMMHAQNQGRLFESQSKGGLVGGAVGKQRRLEMINALKNTYVGDWFVLDQEHVIRGQKAYLMCRCRCGTEQQVEASRLDRKEVANCRACGQRYKRRR